MIISLHKYIKIIDINVDRLFYLKIKGKIYWIFMQKNKSFSNLTGWSLVFYKSFNGGVGFHRNGFSPKRQFTEPP